METHAETCVSILSVPLSVICWQKITADWATGKKKKKKNNNRTPETIFIWITQLDCKQQTLCSFVRVLKYLTTCCFVLSEKNGVSKILRGHRTPPNDKFIAEGGNSGTCQSGIVLSEKVS